MLIRTASSFSRHLICWLAIACFSSPAFARSFIRDAEIEHTLRLMTDPILMAADIEPTSARLFIINDPTINAFVAGGQNIFFHTGLLMKVDNPEMLMGVIAHEAAHISGAHLTQLRGAADDASLGALLSYILGAAAILGGSGEAGGAIISAGQNTSLRQMLAHYRGNEQQADQAAVTYLRAINLSPAGMLEMFELLRRNERQKIGPGGDAYLRTHPLTTDRIATLRGEVQAHKGLPKQPPANIQLAFSRLQAKLFAFLEEPPSTFKRYPATDQSQAAHMARAVAWFKKPDLDKALEEMDALLAQSPDAFGYDMKGQILFEHGKIPEAIEAYQTANEMLPNNTMILTELGKAYLADRNDRYVRDAIRVLERASGKPDTSSSTYRQLARAYGKLGELGKSYLALARESALKNEPDSVIRYANDAKELLVSNPPLLIQADDLIADAKRVKEEQKETLF